MNKKPKKQICDICGANTDIYTSVHAKNKFIDHKFYDKVCFTCYFVPKTIDQKYNKEGLVVEEIELDYSSENLNTPKELVLNGNADNIKEAKRSYESVVGLCKKKKKNKNKLNRPKADWRIIS